MFFLRNFEWPQGIADAAAQLTAGQKRADVLEKAIQTIEKDPAIDSVGRGGFPTLGGRMQLDAAFMDGNTRALGTIAALSGFLHPVSIARRLMETGLHTMLAGDGAEHFAMAQGFQRCPDLLTAEQRIIWERNVSPKLPHANPRNEPDLVRALSAPPAPQDRDTVVMIAADSEGLSCATSTSGWPYKLDGRVGDAPICGGGFYVDSRYGGCVCTYTGEMAMRAGTARYVVAQLERGASPQQAVIDGLMDATALRGGQIDALAVYAVNANGDDFAAQIGAPTPASYWYWRDGMKAPQLRHAHVLNKMELK